MSSADAGPEQASEDLEVFRLDRSLRAFFVIFYVFAAVIAGLAARSSVSTGDTVGLVFLAVWATLVVLQAVFVLFRMPWRIELGREAIGFVSLAGRRREIPLAALQRVTPVPLDLNRQSARWISSHRNVWSPTRFRNWRRLLDQVEQRAPHARVEI